MDKSEIEYFINRFEDIKELAEMGECYMIIAKCLSTLTILNMHLDDETPELLQDN